MRLPNPAHLRRRLPPLANNIADQFERQAARVMCTARGACLAAARLNLVRLWRIGGV